MANYPSPCDKCKNNKNNNCTSFRSCQKWLKRYRYRQKQINAYAKKVLPGMCETAAKGKETAKDQSPCLTCTRVRDPYNCGNKNCETWQQWFLGRWKRFNDYYKKQQDKEK